MGRQGPITFPYEKYGSTHPIQLKVSTYMDGNLAIAMHTWENGYAEPWASLTVNLDGERGKTARSSIPMVTPISRSG